MFMLAGNVAKIRLACHFLNK